jgi:ABC-type antimicrobial peptide transport system permease subunit
VLAGLSFRNFQDYQRQNQVLSGVTCFIPLALTWSGGAEARQVNGQMVSANYFDVLGLQPAAGRFFLPDEDTKLSGNNVAVISYSFWTNKLGSDPNEIGKTLTLNAMPYTVIGVTPKGFKGTFTFGSAEQTWIPTSMYPQVFTGFAKEFFYDRRFLNAIAVGRLKHGIGINQAEASLKTIAAQLEKDFPKDNGGRSITLTPLSEAAVGVNQYDQISLAGTMLMTVVGLVLLIACANLANLLLARAARREREMGLRAALGASRPRLIRQMLTECILLSLIGGGAGLAIA